MAENINIGGRLHSVATGNVVVGTNEILDDTINKKQSEINVETYRLVENINENLENLNPEQTEALSVAEKANNHEVKLGYFECETESNIATKVISNATGYIISKGGSIKIKMINANTASNVTLNINSTGAKTLYYNGELTSPTNTWENNEIIEVYYDGNNYYSNNIESGGKFATGEKVKNVGIDSEPTAGSDNLVKSGEVYKEVCRLGREIKSIDYEINGGEANIDDFTKVENGYIKPNGDILAGSSFDYYVIHNFDFKNISVFCAASSAMSAIAFYNSEEIGANTLISNILGVGFVSTTPYTTTVPVGCKTIVVSNRTGETITASLKREKGLVGKFISSVSSRNLIDKNASGVLIGYYVAGVTIDGGGTYGGNTTDYIPVLPSTQYSFYTGCENGAMRFITYYDAEKNVISYEQNAVVITTPVNASYVRITIANEYWNNCSFGVGVLGNVTVHKSVVSPQNIEIVPSNGYVHFVGTLLQNRIETLLPVHLGYGYNATLLISNVFNTIRFGFGESEYNGGFVEINATEVKVYSYYSTLDLVQTYEHGLTIGERTYIQLIKDRDNSTKIILCSMGYSFETSLVWNPRGTLFVHYLTGNPIAYKVGYCPTMINKSIWVFGDSYYGNDPNRFVGYLFENNQNDWLINNKPGIASPASLIDLKTLLSLNGNPKYVLWGLGMNDPQDTDENTPNADWLQNVQEVIQLCEDNEIIPILATIPSALAENVTPNVLYYHDAKSKWIRNSGYRYIDFAKSVGAQQDGTWYNGCKNTDIHPSVMGAKMMYEQCLVDFPEIASKGF